MAGLIAVLACAVLPVHAQSPERNAGIPATVSVRQPTAAEIERAAREHRMPTDAELERVPIPSTPKLNVTGPTAPLDIERLARQIQDPQATFERGANDTAPRLQIQLSTDKPNHVIRGGVSGVLTVELTNVGDAPAPRVPEL